MVNHLNENEYGHVLTVEDPIEFVHALQEAASSTSARSPAHAVVRNALRSALRAGPDAILVGEMRDLETIAWR